MPDKNLPSGPLSGDERLPATSDPSSQLPGRPRHELSLDIEEERPADPDEIDLLAYWNVLLKRRGVILGIVGVCVALALVLTLVATPIYRATTVMRLDSNDQQVLPSSASTGVGYNWDPEYLSMQYGLLRSRSLAERVADDLNMDAKALASLQPPSWLTRVKRLVRPEPVADASSTLPDAEADAASDSDRQMAADIIQSSLSVEPDREAGRLVKLHFYSPVPQFAARAANAVADGFIASEMDSRFGASDYAKSYLQDQLALVKSRLEDSERELVAFAQRENLVTSEGGQSLVGQNLSDLNASLAAAQSQRIRAQSRWQAASGGAIPQDMLANSMMTALQTQRAQLQRTYQEKLQLFKPDYPEMQALQGQLDELSKQINAELASIRASVKAQYDAALSEERLLTSQLGSLRSETLDVDNRSIQYNILKREVDTNRQLYDGLLQRFKEVGVAGDLRPTNISIVDRAKVPRGRFSPSVAKNVVIGLLLGLLLGVIVAFVLEFLDDTLKTPEDIERRLKLTVLGIIPRLTGKQTPATASLDPRSAFSESYRSVRTALQFASDSGIPKVLLITSAGPGEGKSTTAMALGRNFAQLGKRVLIVEADMRNPALHKSVNRETDKGLSNLLVGDSSLPEVVAGSGTDGLDVIFAGPLPPNPAELLAGSRMVSLLAITREHYDQIIIDGPPTMGIADAPILANAAGATLMVVHSGSTKIATAQGAIKRLRVARAHLLGVVLTKYDAKIAGYGYQYEGYYAYGNAPQLTQR